MTFPDNFVWGAATSAYQIEGAVREDGRGESIWDRFSHFPGNVANGDTGDVACDHYHRWRDDIGLMRELNLSAYRFSVAWPRILPHGWGVVNEAGLDFYDRLVDELLANGIEPWVTLYHWDLPVRIDTSGGWTHRSSADAFADYADIVTRRLGDRVDRWMTINEPWVISILGYALGIHAPGHRDWGEALAAAHHVLLAHGRAVPVVRANAPGAKVGIVLNPTTVRPASDHEEDDEAAKRWDGMHNRWWLDPLADRGYPQDLVDRFESIMPEIGDADLATIATETDFLGVNFYSPTYVNDDPSDEPLGASRSDASDAERTAMGWTIEPDCLTELLVRINTDYEMGPLYVTENGAAIDDPPLTNETVADSRRTRYIHDHLEAVLAAREEDVPVEGYFCWSLLDNFEWAEGFDKRFGLVHVDFETQNRVIKESGRWFSRVAAAGDLIDPE